MPCIRRCALLGCPSHSLKNPELSFFKFPQQDNPIYEKWKNACQASLSRILPFKRAYICSLHFSPDMVSNRRLLTNAVPTLNMDVPPIYRPVEVDPSLAEREKDRKVNYINAVVHEWLLRAYSKPELRSSITHGMIKGKANEGKQLIRCDEFAADNRWLNRFREAYLKDFTKRVQRKELRPFGTSLDIQTIVKELSFRYPPCKSEIKNNAMQYSYDEQENDDDDDDDEDDSDTEDTSDDGDYSFMNAAQCQVVVDIPKTSASKEQQPESPKLSTYSQALEYLKSLEDFAVAKEDYYAINIIAQLGAEFIKGDQPFNLT